MADVCDFSLPDLIVFMGLTLYSGGLTLWLHGTMIHDVQCISYVPGAHPMGHDAQCILGA